MDQDILINLFITMNRENNHQSQTIDRIGDQGMARENAQQRMVFPVLNIHFSPRFREGQINHRNDPMSAYVRKVESSNVKSIFNRSQPANYDLRRFGIRDGMIYQFSQMGKRIQPDNKQPLNMKLLICVCMYNEDTSAINTTLNGIYNNLQSLEKQGISSQQIAVVLIQDGILKLVDNRKTRTYAKGKDSMIHFYKELDRRDGRKKCILEERIHIILDEAENMSRKGMEKDMEENKDFPISIEKNIALLYQNLWKPSYTNPPNCPVKDTHHHLKLFSCFKHTNGTKLSSHLWFFQGFCRFFEPQYIVLLDVGTKPEKEAIVSLVRGLQQKDVGGVTGLMTVDLQMDSQQSNVQSEKSSGFAQCLRNWFFSVQRAQEYEYIISHFIDKNAESILGFLHVLPGAWSAYRYRALIKSNRYEPNLLQNDYFKMVLNPNLQEKDFREANMYLAQDRILSLGIYCQTDCKYTLKYIPTAVAYTDPMKSHQDLMKQRRRWINSSMFAFQHVQANYQYNVSLSSHYFWSKYINLNLAMLIAQISMITTYISPTLLFYILFTTILQIDIDQEGAFVAARIVSIYFVLVYLVGVAGSLMGNAWIQYAKYISMAMAPVVYGLLGLVTYNIVQVYLNLSGSGVKIDDFYQMSVLVMVLLNLGIFFLVVILNGFIHPKQAFKLLLNTPSYISYQAAYTITMIIHAFCNVDDVSWGTKGASGHGGAKKYEGEKIKFVGKWLFLNSLLSYVLIYIDLVVFGLSKDQNKGRRIILIAIGIYSTAYMTLKGVLAILNTVYNLLSCSHSACCHRQLYEGRAEKVNTLWSNLNEQYRISQNN